jgi:hypothetical protein
VAKAAAWDAADPASVSLSFGQYRNIGTSNYSKKVVVRNYESTARTFAITPQFRYAADAASGALTLSAPPSVTVPANGSATFVLRLTGNASSLPQWTLNGGSQGGNGSLLRSMEFDGYVTIADGTDTLRLPWHILPHKAAAVTPSQTTVALGGASTGNLQLSNSAGAVPGLVDVFALTGTSAKLPTSSFPRPGDNFALVDLKAVGVRMIENGAGTGIDLVQFAVNTWGERAHPNYPAGFEVDIDSNNDGTNDYAIFNAENGGVGATGQNVTVVQNLATNTQVVRFFTTADLNSADAILNVVRSDIGVSAGAPFRFSVLAVDNYYTGAVTDAIPDMIFTMNTPRFTGSPASFQVPVGGTTNLIINSIPGGAAASPSQSGLLLMYRDARTGKEADAITVIE